jgi:hypothetical protein
MFPTKKQIEKWSLPSKQGHWSFLLAIFSAVLGIIGLLLSIEISSDEELEGSEKNIVPEITALKSALSTSERQSNLKILAENTNYPSQAVKVALESLLITEKVSDITIGKSETRGSLNKVKLTGELYNVNIFGREVSGEADSFHYFGKLLDSTLNLSKVKNSTLEINSHNSYVLIENLGDIGSPPNNHKIFIQPKNTLGEKIVRQTVIKSGLTYPVDSVLDIEDYTGKTVIENCSNSTVIVKSPLYYDASSEYFIKYVNRIDPEFKMGFNPDRINYVKYSLNGGYKPNNLRKLNNSICNDTSFECMLREHIDHQFSELAFLSSNVLSQKTTQIKKGNKCNVFLNYNIGHVSILNSVDSRIFLTEIDGGNSRVEIGAGTSGIVVADKLFQYIRTPDKAKVKSQQSILFGNSKMHLSSHSGSISGGIIAFKETSNITINTKNIRDTIFIGHSLKGLSLQVQYAENLNFGFVTDIDCNTLKKIPGHKSFIFSEQANCNFGTTLTLNKLIAKLKSPYSGLNVLKNMEIIGGFF